MGLAGPKNRTKLSQDPNNTQWSNSTDRFGHKILTGLGWAPGSTLGAKGAAHAENYTAASASHIRVLLKDDNLGLGARRGKADEQFGLSIFQNLLGRLNGKSDSELEKEQEKRRDVELKMFQSKRFGSMNFVSGGFLVGDKIEKLVSSSAAALLDPSATPVMSTLVTASGVTVKAEEVSKAGKKRKRGSEDAEQASADASKEKTEDKSKKKSKKNRVESAAEESHATTETEPEPVESAEPLSEKEQRRKAKAERKAEKEAKRLRKEEKRRRKEAKKSRKQQQQETQSSSESNEDESATEPREKQGSTQSTMVSITAPAALSNGRHIVRSRYIAQKRMAFSSEQALKEIFMIKAPG